MDEMKPYEVTPLLEGLKYTDRNQWEQTRLRMCGLANMFSKEKLNLTDIMKFPWEDGFEGGEHNTEMSNEDRMRLHERAKKLALNLKIND